MAASLHGGNAREGASESGPHGRLRVGCIGDTEARTDTSVPARNQAARVFAARAEAGEPQRSQVAIGARIRPGRIEVGILVLRVYGRQSNVISHAEVNCQLARDAPIVLRV